MFINTILQITSDAPSTIDDSDVSTITHILWIVGMCLSAIGAGMIYREWSMGKPDMEEKIMRWIAGIVLLWIILLVVPNLVNW